MSIDCPYLPFGIIGEGGGTLQSQNDVIMGELNPVSLIFSEEDIF